MLHRPGCVLVVGVLSGGIDVESESSVLAQVGMKVSKARQVFADHDGVHKFAVVLLKLADGLAAVIGERKGELSRLARLHRGVRLIVDFQAA